MTPSETAAFRAGIRHAADMALITAITIEIRPDAQHVRQRAAIEALRGLAEGLKDSCPASPIRHVEASTGSGQNLPVSQVSAAQAATNRETALAAGFTGDACPSCGSFAMKRAGTCLTCQGCGSTTGCG